MVRKLSAIGTLFAAVFVLIRPAAAHPIQGNVLPIKSAQETQVGFVDGAKLLENLRALVAEMDKLKAELVVAADRPSRLPDAKQLKYQEYADSYSAIAGRVSQFNSLLNAYYEQVNAVYRNDPKSSIYKELVKVYGDAGTLYREVSDQFKTVAQPTTLRKKAAVLPDSRLNERIAAAMGGGGNAGVSSETLQQARSVNFVGMFDGVALYLLTWENSEARYITVGWRERTSNASGKVVDTLRTDLACTPAFQLSGELSPLQHYEAALRLKFTPLRYDGPQLVAALKLFDVVKSYSSFD